MHLVLNSATASQSKRNGAEGIVLARIGPKAPQKYVQRVLSHTRRCFPTSSQQPSMGKPSNAQYPGAALLLAGTDFITRLMNQTPRGCLQSPLYVLQHLLLSAVPQPALPPAKEPRSKGCSFPISTPRISEWKERDAIQRVCSHMKNANPFCRQGWTCSKPHETSPQTLLSFQACSN